MSQSKFLRISLIGLLAVLGEALAQHHPPISSQYFGQHLFYTAADMRWPGEKPTPVPSSVGTWRLWDAFGTEWRYIQPQPNQWRFEYLDRYVAQAQARGISILLTLGQTPAWASARPDEATSSGFGNAAEPERMADWIEYVRTLATRYKGRIAGYEIWNEPAFKETDRIPGTSGRAGYFSGSARSMVALTREAAKVIRQVDPQALVVSPSMAGQHQGLRRLDAFLKAGGGEYVDVIGFHFYLVDTTAPEELPGLVERVRQLLTVHGVGNRPIWNTESGLVIQSPGKRVMPLLPHGRGVLSVVFSDEMAAGMLARYLVLGVHSGLERYYWFAWDSGSMGLLTAQKPRVPNKAGHAYATMRRWLEGARFNGCTEDPEGYWRCRLSDPRNNRQAEIVWSATGYRPLSTIPGMRYCEHLLDEPNSNHECRLSSAQMASETPLLIKSDVDIWQPKNSAR